MNKNKIFKYGNIISKDKIVVGIVLVFLLSAFTSALASQNDNIINNQLSEKSESTSAFTKQIISSSYNSQEKKEDKYIALNVFFSKLIRMVKIDVTKSFVDRLRVLFNNKDVLNYEDDLNYDKNQMIYDQLNSEKQTNALKLRLDQLVDNQDPMQLDISDPWWNTSWYYRKEITIDHSKVDASLTDFTVLIKTTDTDLMDDAQDDGDDITFTDDDGNKLNHEIEYFNGSSGEFVCWVKVTSLSSIEDTVLYMYYGNLVCDSQENVAGTWDDDYVGVWHFNEVSGNALDSTSYGNNGTLKSGVTQNVTGRINSCYSYAGSSGNRVDLGDPDSVEFHDAFTSEAWIYTIDTSTRCDALGKFTSGGGGPFYQIFKDIDNKIQFGYSPTGANYKRAVSTTTMSTGTWYHVTGRRTGVNYEIFVDGASEQAKTDGATGDISSIGHVAWGNNGGCTAPSLPWDGLIDEGRLSKVYRSTEWVNASYLTMSDPDFMSIGSEEVFTGNHLPFLSSENPSDGSTGINRNTGIVSVYINDRNGDLMNWSIEVNNGDSNSDTDASNGTISCSLSTPLDYLTTYTWWVNVTDGTDWTNKTYNFISTEFEPPTFLVSAYNKTVINITSITGPPDADSIMIRFKEGVASSWWDYSWEYNKQLNISGAISGYQMLLTVYKNDGYDNPVLGVVDCDGYCWLIVMVIVMITSLTYGF